MGKWIHKLSEINSEERVAICAHCGPVTIHFKGYTNNGIATWACAIRKQQGRNSSITSQWHHLKGDRCEICGGIEKLVIDHDHQLNEFRGTLCHWCNIGLGMFKDNPELLRKAAEYL